MFFFNLELLEQVFKNKAECNPRILCVFMFFLKKFQITTRVFHVFLCFFQTEFRSQPLCFTCFCDFLCTNRKVYFKSGQTPNVFYVFLCFSSGHWEYHTCILCIFVFFSQLDLRPQPMCFMCFSVFFLQGILIDACVSCVFVF